MAPALVGVARPSDVGITAEARHGSAVAQSEPAFDRVLTDTARILAGLPPSDEARFRAVMARGSWKAHASEFSANWTKVDTGRFREMRAWRDRELKGIAEPCQTVFYSVRRSGRPERDAVLPEVPHVSAVWSRTTPGSVPALDRLAWGTGSTPCSRSCARPCRILFVRDYFISKEMAEELKSSEVDGTLPLMLAFLARLDGRIVAIHRDAPWDAQSPSVTAAAQPSRGTTAPSRRPTSFTIDVLMPGETAPRQVVYARVFMQDPEFAKQTALIEDLRARAPVLTFLKSASYLLHDDQFAMVRSLVLESRAVLEDDSGVPYRFFDAARWNVTLFGHYQAPVKSFNYGYQKDLDAAFRKPGAALPLPFSYGYHQRDGTSSVILAVRKPM